MTELFLFAYILVLSTITAGCSWEGFPKLSAATSAGFLRGESNESGKHQAISAKCTEHSPVTLGRGEVYVCGARQWL